MKRYRVVEIILMGCVDVPDDVDPFTFMEENDAWPDDDEVIDHEITELVFEETLGYWIPKDTTDEEGT